MSLIAWYAGLGVVITFTGAWFYPFVLSISELESYWNIHMVMSLFSAVWFVFLITRKHTIRWPNVAIIVLACFAAFLTYVMVLLFATGY